MNSFFFPLNFPWITKQVKKYIFISLAFSFLLFFLPIFFLLYFPEPNIAYKNQPYTCSSLLFQSCQHTTKYPFSSHVKTIIEPSHLSSELWHARLGHLADSILKHALKFCNVSFQYSKQNVCYACQYAKSRRLPFSSSTSRATHHLALVHTDLWGPAPITSSSDARCFLLFINDFSRFSWIYPLHTKAQALATFVKFKILVEN